MFKGSGISKEQLSTTGSSCILYGELYTTYHDEVISEIKSKTNIDSKGLVKSKSNDIIIPSSGETAIDIATARCVLSNDVYIGGDLNILRPYNCNGCFMSYQLNGKRKFEIARVAQGASIVHLHNEHIENLNIYLPESSKEQEDVVDFMMLIDKKINTQSKIIEQIKSQINSICHIMCKVNNETVKLKEVCSFENKTNHQSGEGLSSGKYIYFTNEEETTKYFNSYDFDGEYIIANTGGKANFKYYNGKFATMSDCLVIKCFKNIEPKFILYVLLNFIAKINHIGFVGSGLKHLDKDWFENMSIPQYSSIHDQYLNLINNLVLKLEKEELLLQKLKEQKKYLLSNMFI